MFSFPSFTPDLWGGALVLIRPITGVTTSGTGLLFSSPDHLSSPLQISLDYGGTYQSWGFAMQYHSDDSELLRLFERIFCLNVFFS